MLFHDTWNTFFRNPFGAVNTKDRIALKIKTEDELQLERIFLRLWMEEKETLLEMIKNEDNNCFEAEFYASADGGLIWYYFICRYKNGDTIYYGNNRELLGGVGEMYFEEPPSFQITVSKKNEKIPKWYRE